MRIKKDIQQKILDKEPIKERASEEDLYNVLRSVAPGTHVRTALDSILRAEKGALIAVENEWIPLLTDGGFRINARFTPQKLMELSKMDGAIVLSKDMKRIVSANVLLTPDTKTPTSETGTRHKAAERIARQAATLVLAISEKRHEITLYYKNLRYPLADSGELLRKANEHIQIIEKQREIFDSTVQKLNYLELRNYPSLETGLNVIQRARLIGKIATGLKGPIIELGKEGTLIKTRLKEITADVEKESDLAIKDYAKLNFKMVKSLISELTYDDLLVKDSIAKSLGYESPIGGEPAKGWRILSKTSLSEPEIAAIIKEAQSLGKAIHSKKEFHDAIIGAERAKIFREELEDIKLNI